MCGNKNTLVFGSVSYGLLLEFSQDSDITVVFVKRDAVLHFERHAILGNLHRVTDELARLG